MATPPFPDARRAYASRHLRLPAAFEAICRLLVTGSAGPLAEGPDLPFARVDEQTDGVSVQPSRPLVPCAAAEAVAEMPLEEHQLNRLDRPPYRIRLYEETRTRLVAPKHAADSLQVTLHTVEPPQDVRPGRVLHVGCPRSPLGGV